MLTSPSLAYTVDSSMQGSIYQGLYSLQKQPVFQCASNCTWAESHLSLGFHAECQNVTAATYAARVCTADYDSAPLSGANCNMTTPGNVTFKIAMDPTVWTTVLVVKAVPLYPEYVTGVSAPWLSYRNYLPTYPIQRVDSSREGP